VPLNLRDVRGLQKGSRLKAQAKTFDHILEDLA
jgi:hypothetical protein